MTNEVTQISTAIVTTLAPFLPFLIEIGKAGGKKISEVIAEKSGEVGWEKAQEIWTKLKNRLGDDAEVKSAATMVAVKPEDENRRAVFAEILADRLKNQPDLAKDILSLLGGESMMQHILASQNSWIESVNQKLTGSGTQIVQAEKDSVIRGVSQTKL